MLRCQDLFILQGITIMLHFNIARGLLLASALTATAGHAAPILAPQTVTATITGQLPTLPPTPVLESLVGNEFPLSLTNLSGLKLGNGPVPRPVKPGQKVSEPNGLYLLGLGVFSMGALRLRTKNQSL